MAILHAATLQPSKLEMISDYLADQPYGNQDLSSLRQVGSYRFDDPAGEVGVEVHLVATDGGPVFQLPMTYRAEPLPQADAWLIGTMEHSVLGRRWVYHGCGDPVFRSELARTVLGGGTQVEMFVESDDGPIRRDPTVEVRGSGSGDNEGATVGDGVDGEIDSVCSVLDGAATTITAQGMEMVVRHRIDGPVSADGKAVLSGTWADADEPEILALIAT